jgi:hypothetical protein
MDLGRYGVGPRESRGPGRGPDFSGGEFRDPDRGPTGAFLQAARYFIGSGKDATTGRAWERDHGITGVFIGQRVSALSVFERGEQEKSATTA